jgi:hypothetical protein
MYVCVCACVCSCVCVCVCSAVNGNDIAMTQDQKYRIIAWHTGMMRWAPLMTWVTTCKMSVYYFPYDVQTCQVVFTNWMYTANLVNLTLGYNQLILQAFNNHSEWLLVDYMVSDAINTVVCCINTVNILN